MTNRLGSIIAVAGLGVALLYGQRVLSPAAETSVTINGKKITINYSAPSMRNRKIFGSLVPFNQVWRTGANAATELTTDANLNINGLQVPKGKYSLFTYVQPDSWELIVNKQTGMSGLDYDKGQDLGRVKMTVTKTPAPVETLKITLEKAGGNKARITMAWEETMASIAFTVE